MQGRPLLRATGRVLEEGYHGVEVRDVRAGEAEKNPKSLLARIWRFHTKFCPGWKAYQKELAQQQPQPQQTEE